MDLLTQDWKIEIHSGIPAYKQVVHYIQAAIAAGQLREGEQLPTIRALHQKLKLNPNTIAKAYRELEVAGLITGQRGSGSFVAPPREVVKTSPKVKQEKLAELYERFAAEARSFGIQPGDIARYFARRGSNA